MISKTSIATSKPVGRYYSYKVGNFKPVGNFKTTASHDLIYRNICNI